MLLRTENEEDAGARARILGRQICLRAMRCRLGWFLTEFSCSVLLLV